VCAAAFFRAVQCTDPTWGCHAAHSEDVDCIYFSTQSYAHVQLLTINLQCRAKMPRIVAAWLRCYVMVNVVYFLTGGMWAYYVYVCWGDKFFAPGNMPSLRDMGEQIKVRHHNMLNSDSNSSWLRTMFCKIVLISFVRLPSGNTQKNIQLT